MNAVDLKTRKVEMIEQLRSDLLKFKDDKSLRTKKELSVYLENISGVNYKAVSRIFELENYLPNYSNVFEIYCAIYGTRDLLVLTGLVHPVISEYIVTKNLNTPTEHRDPKKEVNQYVLGNQLATKIYFMTAGHGTKLSDIHEKLGSDGFKEVYKMLEREIVRIDHNQMVTRGKYSLVMNSEALKQVSMALCSSFYREDMSDKANENYIDVNFTSVSPDAYQKILKLSEKFHEHLKLIIKTDDLEKNESQQTVKMFTSLNVDKIQ